MLEKTEVAIKNGQSRDTGNFICIFFVLDKLTIMIQKVMMVVPEDQDTEW